MGSYKQNKMNKTSIKRSEAVEGETIEQKVQRIVQNGEKPKQGDGAPVIYTERKEGVPAGYNIRTDRWEVAIEGMDKAHKSTIAERDARHNPEPDNIGDESIQATE